MYLSLINYLNEILVKKTFKNNEVIIFCLIIHIFFFAISFLKHLKNILIFFYYII